MKLRHHPHDRTIPSTDNPHHFFALLSVLLDKSKSLLSFGLQIEEVDKNQLVTILVDYWNIKFYFLNLN